MLSAVSQLELVTRLRPEPVEGQSEIEGTRVSVADGNNVRRIVAEVSRSNCCNAASGRRIRARQYAAALTAWPARCRWVV